MSLGVVRASPLGESALSWDHDPMTRPSGGVSVMAFSFLFSGINSLCDAIDEYFSISFPQIRSSHDGYRGNEHVVSFDMYKLRLQT